MRPFKTVGPINMSNTFQRFLRDDSGAVQPATYLLIVCLLALAVIPGLTTLRDMVVQEFGDAATALDNLDQTYSFSVGGTMSVFTDTSTLTDLPNNEPACISVRATPTPE